MQWAEVGGLGEAAIAFLLFGLCVGAYKLIQAIGASLGTINLVVVSVPIGKWFTDATQPVVHWLVGASATLWGDGEWWLRNVAASFDWLWGDLKACFEWDAQQIAHLFNTVIPNAAGQASKDISSYADQLGATVAKDIADARRLFTQDISKDAARAYADVATAANHLSGVITHDVSKEWANTEKLISTVKTDVLGVAANGLLAAEGYADALYGDAIGYIDNGIADVRAGIGSAVDAATSPLGVAVAGAVAGVAAITAEFESCAVTSCAGPNNLQNLLGDVLNLAGLVAFGEFLSEVIQNPAAGVADYAGYFQSVVTPLVAGGGDVWGAIESVLGV